MSEQDPVQIDLDTFTSAAVLLLAQRETELKGSIQAVRARAQAEAEQLDRPALVAVLSDEMNLGHKVKAKTTRRDLAQIYADAAAHDSEPRQYLARLQRAAEADRTMAADLNEMITAPAALDKRLKGAQENESAAGRIQMARWALQANPCAELLAEAAAEVVSAYNNGRDFREALTKQTRRCLYVALQFIDDVKSNGFGGTPQREALFSRAQAARKLVQAVGIAYDVDDSFKIGVDFF